MIKPKAIDHIVLRTTQYAELIDFYCQVLGCVVERTLPDDIGLTQLRAGSALIDIIDIIDVTAELGQVGGAAPNSTGNNLDHFCLQIAPFDESELIAFLRSKGLEVDGFEERYGAQGMGRSLYLKDIAGNNIELRAALSK